MTTFTKKHYDVFANLIVDTWGKGKDVMIDSIIATFEDDNPKFSKEKFIGEILRLKDEKDKQEGK